MNEKQTRNEENKDELINQTEEKKDNILDKDQQRYEEETDDESELRGAKRLKVCSSYVLWNRIYN